ncbi:hypothetical protein GCM10027456_40300 [Kineosporia babensis]
MCERHRQTEGGLPEDALASQRRLADPGGFPLHANSAQEWDPPRPVRTQDLHAQQKARA